MPEAEVKNIKVWGIESVRCMRVHWMAQELGLDYEIVPIRSRSGETLTETFTKLNPKQKIPVFEHGPLVLSESAAIIGYMSETFPLPKGFFVAEDVGGRATLSEWCYFIQMELDAHALYLIRRHDYLKHIYGAAPTAVASAEEYFLKQLNAVTKRIDTAGNYLMGEKFSTADILLVSCIDWAIAYEISLPQVVHRYRAHVAERPAYQHALKVNYPNGFQIAPRST